MKIKISYCDREPRELPTDPFGYGYDPNAIALLVFAAVQGAMAVIDGEELDPEDVTLEVIDDNGRSIFHRTASSLEQWGLPEILRNIPHFLKPGGEQKGKVV